jgi:hypothetical protein
MLQRADKRFQFHPCKGRPLKQMQTKRNLERVHNFPHVTIYFAPYQFILQHFGRSLEVSFEDIFKHSIPEVLI